jgi:hypothetical protein
MMRIFNSPFLLNLSGLVSKLASFSCVADAVDSVKPMMGCWDDEGEAEDEDDDDEGEECRE